jgi:hypothetical protein
MTNPLVQEWDICFERRGRGAARELRVDREPETAPAPPARLARVARLMALAIRFDKLVRSGQVRDHAELARLGRVSRARISQIMNLLQLAPDLQERLLFLGRPERGRDPVPLARLQPIAAVLDWRKQRRRWREEFGS